MPIHSTSELNALWASSHSVVNLELAPSYLAFNLALYHEHVSASGGKLDGNAFVVDSNGVHLATIPARNYSRNAVVVPLAPGLPAAHAIGVIGIPFEREALEFAYFMVKAYGDTACRLATSAKSSRLFVTS
ncbi:MULTISPECIES: hypothetical protein [unclassified Ensifer]|uniref:hypothetical protein n=1 Tax=unclassified Ensifer TaxID=2633371 RepID=UPI00070DDEC5|nr:MULTISPECIES: hypothetical protein [unclassified Ensifer]KQW33514.1 hypothetical protein ASD02_18900 [Ensifer sp. Root1252]KRC78688.1 hypothetical protein ASE32_26870 [Ensifer sp. Root231]KRD02591.1 hypothetical protein ASE47_19960 [Ensifer sp. Root258]